MKAKDCVKGQWYKISEKRSNPNPVWIKFKKRNKGNRNLIGDEYVYDEAYERQSDAEATYENQIIEHVTDFSEIIDYLPEGHPDIKTTQLIEIL